MENAGIMRGSKPVGDTGQQLYDIAPIAITALRPALEGAAVDKLRYQLLPSLAFTGRRLCPTYCATACAALACSLRASALSVPSQEKVSSERPKWPKAAVLR
jgi:hypothetical protein